MADSKQTAFKKKDVDALFTDAAPKESAAVKEGAAPKEPSPANSPVEKTGDELALVASAALHGFPDHPYTVDENDNDMAELVDSIQREGLLERIVVQRRKEGGFEILSGHRRHRACQILGISEVPVLIKNGLSKDQAILLMVDANLKRKNILPMDEARALKMQMDAMNRMGQRPAHGKMKRTDELIADKISKNRMYVQRKVKLLDLTPELQQAVNDKTLSETPAFEIAYLPADVQELLHDWMIYEDRAPTVAQAISVRQHQQELVKVGKGKKEERLLTEEQVERIMDGERLTDIFPPPPEPKKEEQAEKVDVTGPQAPTAGKEDGPAGPMGAAAPMPSPGEPGGEAPQPGAVADPKAIPFQTPNTQPLGAGPVSPGAVAPTAAAAPPAPPAPDKTALAADATKSYIRTEYMAELRKDNVILPKSDIKGLVPRCENNLEYVIAIKKVLTEAKAAQVEKKAPDTKSKDATPPKTPVSTAPKTAEPAKVDTVPAAPAPKGQEPPKADKPPTAPAPKAPEPAKTGPASLNSAPKTPEPPKTDKAPIVAASKVGEPPKTDKPPVAPAPKAAEPPKANKAEVGKNPTSAAVPLPKPTEPAKQENGTKALDDFLKNKPRPGKGKEPQKKLPDKTK